MSITPVPRLGIIVVAAGSGSRLGVGMPKAFVGIDSHTILRHALRGVFATGIESQVVVVVPSGREGDALTEVHEAADAAEHATASGRRRDLVRVVTGGATRQESVAAGLGALWPSVEIVLVHDAARALTPTDVFARVVDAVDATGSGVVPVLPVVDTLKRVDGASVVEGVDRAPLAAAQTPQGFPRHMLDEAYAKSAAEFTDDAALVAALGHPISTVLGDERAFKITTAADLERARALVATHPIRPIESAIEPAGARITGGMRVGIGTDVHAFGDGGDLWLAGLHWPGEPALSGHSDGDAVAHAIVDALVSAAGIGDIGTLFGTDRPEFEGAHADVFLAETLLLLRRAGWQIGNVAVQVQATRPRFTGRRAEVEATLSAALGGAPVSVSATTTDGLGFVGTREGVQAFAVALLLPA